MAALLAGTLALSVDSIKNKRRERRERREAELQRSLSDAGPSNLQTMAIGEDEEHEDSEAARAKAREAYEEHNNGSRRGSTDSTPETRRHNVPADDLPPPYADAPPYAEHQNDTLLSSTPRRKRHSRRASEGQPTEHAFDRRAGRTVWHRQPSTDPNEQTAQPRQRSPPRPGETEEQRKKRKEKEFWNLKGGAFWGLVGVSLARGIATM